MEKLNLEIDNRKKKEFVQYACGALEHKVFSFICVY